MNPELLMIESDHDLRNSADFLVIDKIAKAVFRVQGISRVQAITRPDGKPIEHTSIPFQISMQGTTQKLNEKYNQDLMANMLKQADEMQTTIDTMEKMSASHRADGGRHAQHGRQDEGHDRRRRPNCATTSRISTTSSARSATTSTGNRTASTSRSAGRSGRCSTPSTASTR